MGNIFNGFGGMVGPALAGLGFASLASDVFNVGTAAEQTKIAFETFLGSSEAATEQIEKLQNFADVSPFIDIIMNSYLRF